MNQNLPIGIHVPPIDPSLERCQIDRLGNIMDRIHQEYFEIAGMYNEFQVIRIWEVPVEELLRWIDVTSADVHRICAKGYAGELRADG
jgi:hypothetical protein